MFNWSQVTHSGHYHNRIFLFQASGGWETVFCTFSLTPLHFHLSASLSGRCIHCGRPDPVHTKHDLSWTNVFWFHLPKNAFPTFIRLLFFVFSQVSSCSFVTVSKQRFHPDNFCTNSEALAHFITEVDCESSALSMVSFQQGDRSSSN